MSTAKAALHDHLPACVRDLAMRLGADGRARPRNVRLKQAGRMKQNLDSSAWMDFTATQAISVSACGFDWRARFGPFGAVAVRDALIDGQGQLDITALRLIPLSRTERSAALTRGELMRYLAELPLAPDAILHNSQLRWRDDGEGVIGVSAGGGDTACEVLLSLDGEGRVASCFAPDRPRSAKAPFLPTPWRGRFSDYRWYAGRWLPFGAEVGWEIGGKEIVYWQGRMLDWKMV